MTETTAYETEAYELTHANLPSAQELTRMARNGLEPEAFAQARAELEAARAELEAARGRLHELLAAADSVGVKPGALQRWSGYGPARIYQLRERSLDTTKGEGT